MGASDYCEEAILNALFGKTSAFGTLSARPTIYVALLTDEPSDADDGESIAEPDYTGYARVATAATDWNAWANDKITNANAITFPEATSGSSTVTHFALVDASTGGNVLFYGALPVQMIISTGITPMFKAGDLAVTAD